MCDHEKCNEGFKGSGVPTPCRYPNERERMTTRRHYIASGPRGSVPCSTHESAVLTLANQYRITRGERGLLRAYNQHRMRDAVLSIEACDCSDPASHVSD